MNMKKIVEDIEISSHQSQGWNMFDENEDTCWFSSHGNEQSIDIYLNEVIYIEEIQIYFQKGFHCRRGRGYLMMKEFSKDVEMRYSDEEDEGYLIFKGYGDHIRIILEESSDIYGRYCIYKICRK